MILVSTGAFAQCSELFFSEYLEGASNNKAIEFYNPTSATVNLTNYTIYRYNNGSPVPTDSLFPQGTLAPGAVFVAGNPSAVAAILSVSDTLHTITFFNGDDVLALKNNTTGLLVDIIGVIGVDPGINWPVGTGATSEFTLVRMVGIQQGNTNWTTAANEYDVYPQNTTTFLGNHTMTACCTGVIAQLSSFTNNSCYSDSTGTATVSATGSGLTYSWMPYGGTTATASGLIAGTYTCIVSDPCANADTVTVTLTQPPYLDTINVSQTAALCNGDSNGSLTVNGSGGVAPYTYLWSTSATTNSISGLSSGFYTYTITDANGCTRTDSLFVMEPPVLTSTFTAVSPTCAGYFNGSITAMTSGGNSNCTFLWSNNATTQTITNLSAGVYSCVATDINGCTTSFTATLTQPTAVTAAADSVIVPGSCGALDGGINITAAGGTPGYTYLWSNNSTAEDISGIGAGSYSCIITDANGCTTTTGAQLTDPNAPMVILNLPDTQLCDFPVLFTLSGESPAGGSWSGTGVTGNQFDPSQAGIGFHVITYSYTDSAGCTGISTDTMEVVICIGIVPITENAFEVYPNPAGDEINIRSDQSGFTYKLYDALGNEVLNISNTGTSVKIDVSEFADGIYVLRGDNGNAVITKKIVLSR